MPYNKIAVVSSQSFIWFLESCPSIGGSHLEWEKEDSKNFYVIWNHHHMNNAGYYDGHIKSLVKWRKIPAKYITPEIQVSGETYVILEPWYIGPASRVRHIYTEEAIWTTIKRMLCHYFNGGRVIPFFSRG